MPRVAIAAVLAASLWVCAAPAQAENSPLASCQRVLNQVAEYPLSTLEYYPDYLFRRLANAGGALESPDLSQCEQRLWRQVDDNFDLMPALLNAECRRSDALAPQYRSLRSYYLGYAKLACQPSWFGDLSRAEWRRSQPRLASLNRLEEGCYQALEVQLGAAEDGNVLDSVINQMLRLPPLRTLSFDALPGVSAEAMAQRRERLRQCQRLLDGSAEPGLSLP